ncbi:MAG: DUF924 domain-containing protein [endosymbiont of Galathealinum brachiosum]|uniref:DUF924 domain-containing protein n=1 Tax=endosymbiont of Galathealinum brachiosum TaxID=2200906 RepID=A0A370DJE9_9GAMM|nr:MAG: DUF924 domain-containing protein [endosymbiont of Galathealinum brachiosum]
MEAEEIIQFWFSEPMNKHWFKSTPEIDALIRDKFEVLWRQAFEGALDSWEDDASGCLALILLFDQFPLNMFRGKAQGFLTEARSIELALSGIKQGYDQQIPKSQLSFFYMPLMHSELMEHQNLSVEKFEQAGFADNARFARHHRSIVEKFGRFPHRNGILGRDSTQAELDYLNSKEAFTG